MLTVQPQALTKLNTYLSENNIDSSLRITLMNGGCAGTMLGLALDEKKEDDRSFTEGNLTFLVNEELLKKCGKIEVSYIENVQNPGFAISSENPVGGGGCASGSCSSGSCG